MFIGVVLVQYTKINNIIHYSHNVDRDAVRLQLKK